MISLIGCAETNRGVVDLGLNEPGPRRSPWLRRYKRAPDAPPSARLFCFHYAGGSSEIFRPWIDSLPMSIELVATQLPGHGYRFAEPLVTDLAELADEIALSIEPDLDRPYIMFGHSMGALLAFEVLRRLRTMELPQPELFIASGRNAPQYKWLHAGVELLPDDEFAIAVQEYCGVSEDLLVETSLREIWMPKLRADLAASTTYRFEEQTPLMCPMLVMSGADDGSVSAHGLAGWSSHTMATTEFAEFRGGHLFLHESEPQVLETITHRLNCISRARGTLQKS